MNIMIMGGKFHFNDHNGGWMVIKCCQLEE